MRKEIAMALLAAWLAPVPGFASDEIGWAICLLNRDEIKTVKYAWRPCEMVGSEWSCLAWQTSEIGPQSVDTLMQSMAINGPESRFLTTEKVKNIAAKMEIRFDRYSRSGIQIQEYSLVMTKELQTFKDCSGDSEDSYASYHFASVADGIDLFSGRDSEHTAVPVPLTPLIGR